MKRKISAMDDLPEEILLEILNRLGIKPLFRCKCVSKQFNSLISDPKFSLNYLQSSSSLCHLSALLYPQLSCFVDQFIDLSHSDSAVLRTDDDRPPSFHAALYGPDNSSPLIEASCGGLILCRHISYAADFRYWGHKFSVFNPLTHQSITLPTLHLSEYRWAFGLATRAPQRSVGQNRVTYKVVCIQFISGSPLTPNYIKFATIDIFSSDTGRWTRKELIRCPAAVTIDYSPRLLTYKDILHCFDWKIKTVLTYDPYDSPERLGSIQLPDRSGRKVMNSGLNLIRLGLQDLLEFGEIEDCGDRGWRPCVWRLVDYDDKREWCLQNRCPISPQWNPSLLRDCRLLVAPDPLKAEFFCWLSAYNGKVVAHDLASAEKVCVDLFNAKAKWALDYVNLVVPISLNPWSSPFHGEVGRNSSSIVGIRKIIPAWFPSYPN